MSGCADIWMENLGLESNFWRLERVVRRKSQIEMEEASVVNRSGGWEDSSLPVEEVLRSERASCEVRGSLVLELSEFRNNSAKSHY